MKKSILIPVAIATIGLTGVSVFASTNTNTSANNTPNTTHKMAFGGHQKGMQSLTDAEKTALASMTDTQKQAFFEQKRADMESKMTARENVIDKLLAGQTLTTDEEALRQTIIKERADRKAEMTAMKAKMDQIKVIRDKQKAGTTLTADEQALLNSMPQRGEGKGHGKGERGGFGEKMRSSTATTTTAQ